MPYFAPSPFESQSGFPDLAAAPDDPAQPPATGAANLLDLWAMSRGGNAASNPLDPYGVAGPSPLGAAGFLNPADPHSRFFDQNYGPAAAAAATLGIDPALLLGLAAHESGWGTSRQAEDLGNPFGALPGGRPAQFPSPEAAWQSWAKTFGPRVQDVGGNVEKFVSNLQADQRNLYGPPIGGKYTGAYNSENNGWPTAVPARIQDVRNLLPLWLGYYDGMP